MELTKKHLEVANKLSLGQKSMETIAKEHGICRATIYNWMEDEDFSAFMDQLEKKHKRMALFIAGRWATEAVKRLVVNVTDENGDPEVARKSAMDLLDIAGLRIQKIKGEGFESINETNIINVKNLDDFLGGVHNGDIINRAEDIKRRANGASQEGFASTGDRAIES